jgi:hypothetical protein
MPAATQNVDALQHQVNTATFTFWFFIAGLSNRGAPLSPGPFPVVESGHPCPSFEIVCHMVLLLR